MSPPYKQLEVWTLLQTTGSKDEPNMVFLQTSQHGAKNVKTYNMTTQKTKAISNNDPTNKPGWDIGDSGAKLRNSNTRRDWDGQ